MLSAPQVLWDGVALAVLCGDEQPCCQHGRALCPWHTSRAGNPTSSSEAGVSHLSTYSCSTLYQEKNRFDKENWRFDPLLLKGWSVVFRQQYFLSQLFLLLLAVSFNSPFPAAKGTTHFILRTQVLQRQPQGGAGASHSHFQRPAVPLICLPECWVDGSVSWDAIYIVLNQHCIGKDLYVQDYSHLLCIKPRIRPVHGNAWY